MKITVDLPESELQDAIRFTKTKTKREAIVKVLEDFNRRQRMAELTKYSGTCHDLMSVEELLEAREWDSPKPRKRHAR